MLYKESEFDDTSRLVDLQGLNTAGTALCTSDFANLDLDPLSTFIANLGATENDVI